METTQFLEKREKWLKEVADVCGKYAEETKLDFYPFQTSSKVYQPDILLIGINPGGNRSYPEEGRSWENLDSDPVSLYQKPNWEIDKGADNMRRGLSMVFHNNELKNKLKNTVMINMLFTNTTDSKAAYKVKKDMQDFCREKVLEFIEISSPKNIILFSIDKKKLGSHGVTNISKIEENVNVFNGNWKGRKVFIIPHYNSREPYRYNKKMCELIGDKLLDILS